MNQDQVVTIHEDGTISGLERKDGIDLKQFGHAEIERTSEVLWDENKQSWWVEFKHVPESTHCTFLNTFLWGMVLSEEDWPPQDVLDDLYENDCDIDPAFRKRNTFETRVIFSDYQEAVEAEIRSLDYFRLHGVVE